MKREEKENKLIAICKEHETDCKHCPLYTVCSATVDYKNENEMLESMLKAI